MCSCKANQHRAVCYRQTSRRCSICSPSRSTVSAPDPTPQSFDPHITSIWNLCPALRTNVSQQWPPNAPWCTHAPGSCSGALQRPARPVQRISHAHCVPHITYAVHPHNIRAPRNACNTSSGRGRVTFCGDAAARDLAQEALARGPHQHGPPCKRTAQRMGAQVGQVPDELQVALPALGKANACGLR